MSNPIQRGAHFDGGDFTITAICVFIDILKEISMDSFKTYLAEANRVTVGKKIDRNNAEIKKLQVFLKSVKLKDVEIKITGEENIVNIYLKDPGYMPVAQGAYPYGENPA